MRKQVDFLVIGSGIAGLFYATKVSKYGRVAIICKNKIDDTSTVKAQGGIASVMNSYDSFEKHIEDTMIAGCGINNRKIVEIVVREAPERIRDLVEIGTNFDTDSTGQYDMNREGGHSEKRILHFKDKTGAEIQRALVEDVRNNPNIDIYEDHFAIELITQHHLGVEVTRATPDIKCYGAYVYDVNKKKVFNVYAKKTLIATGGCGNAYMSTTNPVHITGDGIAMVYRAKGAVENMEFVQFHPTTLYNPSERPAFLITEAMRGAGAILRNRKGEDFCVKYDERGSLAPRDVVTRAIDSEMKLSGDEHVYLDARHIDKDVLMTHFPTIYAKCLEIGINIKNDLIPVVPAAHYMCGGIKTDEYARTSIQNLYAVGEAACTGLHGANRLASNSLLEAVVFAHRAFEDSKDAVMPDEAILNKIPLWNEEGTITNEELILVSHSLKELQQIMSNYVGIVRTDLRLKRAFDRLEILYRETEDLFKTSKVTVSLCELRNLINIGYLIIRQAMARRESIGLHFNSDLIKK